jgi:hypothetical protein
MTGGRIIAIGDRPIHGQASKPPLNFPMTGQQIYGVKLALSPKQSGQF